MWNAWPAEMSPVQLTAESAPGHHGNATDPAVALSGNDEVAQSLYDEEALVSLALVYMSQKKLTKTTKRVISTAHVTAMNKCIQTAARDATGTSQEFDRSYCKERAVTMLIRASKTANAIAMASVLALHIVVLKTVKLVMEIRGVSQREAA